MSRLGQARRSVRVGQLTVRITPIHGVVRAVIGLEDPVDIGVLDPSVAALIWGEARITPSKPDEVDLVV